MIEKAKQEWKIGNCLELLPDISDKSIDLILTDLPYGQTDNKWDVQIPLEPLWAQYKRIIKDNGVIVLTASQPYTSILVLSNIDMFKYEWIWKKVNGSGFLNASKMPLKFHENVLVFYDKLPTYNPQMTIGKPYSYQKTTKMTDNYGGKKRLIENNGSRMHNTGLKVNIGTRMPISVQVFKNEGGIHPTQKPVPLFEYIIKTYTNPGDMVHDSCLGAGTNLEACANLNRNCIGFELFDDWEWNYYDIIDKNKDKYQLSRIFGKDLS